MTQDTLRVLMVSDVDFPRINGVSTSIETFRDDLGRHGVEVTLVATIEVNRRNIKLKLGLKTTADLTRYALREGLTDA